MSTPISQYASSQPRQRQQPPNELAGFEAAKVAKTTRDRSPHPAETAGDSWANSGAAGTAATPAAVGAGTEPPF